MKVEIPEKNEVVAAIGLYSDDFKFLKKIIKIAWKLIENHEDYNGYDIR